MAAKTKTPRSKWNQLLETQSSCPAQLPCVTVLIPTYNDAHTIPTTLDSVFGQQYPDLDIIVIDASSTDRTETTLAHYARDSLHVHTVSTYHIYDMINWGITLARGKYVNVLFPGDFYLSRYSIQTMMALALEAGTPDLVYSASLQREHAADPEIMYRPLSTEFLRIGQQPAGLQSCWFNIETLKNQGKFDSTLTERGGLDLFCKLTRCPTLRMRSTSQVMTDYSRSPRGIARVWQHFRESRRIIYRYFGALAVLRWLWHQGELRRIAALWLRNVRVAFLGQ